MSSISLRLSNVFVRSSFPAQVLRAAKPQIDKVTKIAIVAMLALAILACLVIRYGGKFKKWIPFQSYFGSQKRVDIEFQKANEISLDRAKALKNEGLLYLIQSSKSDKDLIEYLKACPDIEHIILNDCSPSNNFFEIPKKVVSIDLINCSLSDCSLEGLSNNLGILQLDRCDLKGVNVAFLPKKIQDLKFSLCPDLFLTSVSAKNCHIEKCKNLQIDNASGNIKNLIIKECDNVSLNHLPKSLDTLTLERCKNLFSLEHLPDNLKSLTIVDCTLINPTLNQLPINLEYLELYLLPSQTLDALPSGLHTLVVMFGDQFSLNHLPQNLKKIEFCECDLRNVCFDSLPDSLESIVIHDGCTGFSLDQMRLKIKNKVSIKYL